jgi:hypothetical protein
MNLDEAIAVKLHLRGLGYPTKAQRAAQAAADEVITTRAEEVVARYSPPPGYVGHSAGAIVMTAEQDSGPAGRPTNSGAELSGRKA